MNKQQLVYLLRKSFDTLQESINSHRNQVILSATVEVKHKGELINDVKQSFEVLQQSLDKERQHLILNVVKAADERELLCKRLLVLKSKIEKIEMHLSKKQQQR